MRLELHLRKKHAMMEAVNEGAFTCNPAAKLWG